VDGSPNLPPPLAGALRAVVGVVDGVAKAASILLVLAVLVIMCAQVWFRYVLNSSLQWSEEAAVWAMIWLVFAGATVLLNRWEHILIPTVIRLFPVPVRAGLILLSRLLVLVGLGVLGYYGVEVVTGPANAFSHNVGLSTAWAKASIPAGCGLMLLVALARVLEDLADILARDLTRFADWGAHDTGEI